jgi:hypothetical protein
VWLQKEAKGDRASAAHVQGSGGGVRDRVRRWVTSRLGLDFLARPWSGWGLSLVFSKNKFINSYSKVCGEQNGSNFLVLQTLFSI